MPMIANGWGLYYFRIFKAALDELEAVVTQLAQDDPRGYKTHPKTKLLASVYKAITEVVPANPDAPEFGLGKTPIPRIANWRRVEKGIPDRYRLFFRSSATNGKVVIYAWLDDIRAIESSHSKMNYFSAFVHFLASGCVPENFDELAKKVQREGR